MKMKCALKKELRERLLADMEKKRLKKAMNFFLRKVWPIVGYAQGMDHLMLRLLSQMDGIAPFSIIDMVSLRLQDEAKEAYRVLLTEEEKGNVEVKEYWEHPRWKTFQVLSFKKRLAQLGEGKVQVIIWVDAAQTAAKINLLDKLDREASEFFSE
uniref:Uncharacterized protein n=1 Tax=candidate division CPR3 bacterium TaxID=2268181 RepID=A0A7V3N4Z2_UNCC3